MATLADEFKIVRKGQEMHQITILIISTIFSLSIRANHYAEAKDWMVSSQGKYSSNAALEVKRVGNIIDAFAALSFAISVERPQSTGIGGGGFLLYFDPEKMEKPTSLDFRETAPIKGNSKMYLDSNGNEIPKKSLIGINAAGVLGWFMGL